MEKLTPYERVAHFTLILETLASDSVNGFSFFLAIFIDSISLYS